MGITTLSEEIFMMIREQIEEKLRTAFDPRVLEVVDESYRHERNVPAGSEEAILGRAGERSLRANVFLIVIGTIYGTLTAGTFSQPYMRWHAYTLKVGKGCGILSSRRLLVAARGSIA